MTIAILNFFSYRCGTTRIMEKLLDYLAVNIYKSDIYRIRLLPQEIRCDGYMTRP